MPTDGKPKNGIVRQLFSYGGVSAMQTFVEFGVFAVLQLAGLPFRLANAVAVFCSGSFNYVMNRNVTFKSSSNYARSIAMFVAMYCWNLLFSGVLIVRKQIFIKLIASDLRILCAQILVAASIILGHITTSQKKKYQKENPLRRGSPAGGKGEKGEQKSGGYAALKRKSQIGRAHV